MNVIVKDNIEYRQSALAPRLYVADDGHYIIPDSKNTDGTKVREPTKNYNTKGYPLAAIVCTMVKSTVDGEECSKKVVINIGRLVLDTWSAEGNKPDMEVDHIDRNPFNNHISNLRFVTRDENIKNRRKRTDANFNNPTWLNTPEIAAKRAATRKAKREGTYVPPIKEIKERKRQYSKEIIEREYYEMLIRQIDSKINTLTHYVEERKLRCAEIEEASKTNRRRVNPTKSKFYNNHKDKIKVYMEEINKLNEKKNEYINKLNTYYDIYDKEDKLPICDSVDFMKSLDLTYENVSHINKLST